MFPLRFPVADFPGLSSILMYDDAGHVFTSFLSFEDLCRQSAVSRQFHSISSKLLQNATSIRSEREKFPLGAISVLCRRCPSIETVPVSFFTTSRTLPVEIVRIGRESVRVDG